MKKAIIALLSPCICCHAMAAEQDTHLSLAQEVVNLLSETEICLNLCQDEQSVEAQLPKLQELAQLALDIQSRQKLLPDATLSEDIQIHKQCVPDFTTLQKAIDAHIIRLRNSNLITPELAEILGEAC